MKIVITGSLGNIGMPLTQMLVQKEYSVIVISSDPHKRKKIEALGASAAIGRLEDLEFLTAFFTGADAVYCMVPPNYYFNNELEPAAFYCRMGYHYSQAIMQAGVKRVVHLSSIGAHLEKNSGLVVGHRAIESILKKLPADISITHLRSAAFYYNLNSFIKAIKKQGFISANYGAQDIVPWVSPIDIANAITEEITTSFTGRKVRYVASVDDLSCQEVAEILGAAIEMPKLKWEVFSDKQMQNRLEALGTPFPTAKGLVEMNACLHKGTLQEDYYRNKPRILGKVTLKDFSRDFAASYNNSSK